MPVAAIFASAIGSGSLRIALGSVNSCSRTKTGSPVGYRQDDLFPLSGIQGGSIHPTP